LYPLVNNIYDMYNIFAKLRYTGYTGLYGYIMDENKAHSNTYLDSLEFFSQRPPEILTERLGWQEKSVKFSRQLAYFSSGRSPYSEVYNLNVIEKL
jgi:hypothetical protein